MCNHSDIRSYIAFRYNNWLDYARQMAKLHKFEGWEMDLLNEVIVDLLKKPEDKLEKMLSRKTKKMVNSQPTTELDKFVLKMLQVNASSVFAPFRKNILGQKVISCKRNKATTAHMVELNGYDGYDEGFDPELGRRMDRMHMQNIKIMQQHGYTTEAIELYKEHYIKGQPVAPEKAEALQKLNKHLINP